RAIQLSARELTHLIGLRLDLSQHLRRQLALQVAAQERVVAILIAELRRRLDKNRGHRGLQRSDRGHLTSASLASPSGSRRPLPALRMAFAATRPSATARINRPSG